MSGAVAVRWMGLAALCAVAGCDDGVDLDDMPARVAQGLCAKVHSCCSSAELADQAQLGPDQASCEREVTANHDGKKVWIEAGERKGRLAYRGDLLAECLDRLAATTCEAMKNRATSSIPACDTYLEPRVAVGGACGQDEECIGGRCEGETLESDGVCRGYVTEGESCAEATCAQGLYCEPSGKLCRETKVDGAACTTHAECTTGGCNRALPDGGAPGTCGPKGGANTSCFVTSGCSALRPGPGCHVALALVLAVAALSRRRHGAAAR